ncbi:hypothetical protein [Micromonospora sp. AP08]|uniref:hypothetical protein n=1 Tax=Micromonospora sp. AP08 TaxID=2604467 RepID=UPI0021023FF4|nr:hypothetical protein [Micromonospora sp. AP08]
MSRSGSYPSRCSHFGPPGSVVELLGAVGPLTNPTAHGGTAEDAFHLVLPSLPGYPRYVAQGGAP